MNVVFFLGFHFGCAYMKGIPIHKKVYSNTRADPGLIMCVKEEPKKDVLIKNIS